MMHVLGCAQVREDLQAFHDRELPVERLVLIEGHLRDCVSCRLEASDLADIGDALRLASGSRPDRLAEEADRLPATVLERIRVEEQLSFRAQLRSRFEDLHLVWAALGATAATIVCLVGSMGVLHAASREHPQSLAGIISTLADQGSNANPVRLDGRMLVPRSTPDAAHPLTEEDAVFALAAVVTREGRVQNLELLVAEQAAALRVRPEVIVSMLNNAAQTRFEPAQAGGAPVAVSMVWILEHTTVKGRPDYDRYLVSPPPWPAPGGERRPAPPRTGAQLGPELKPGATLMDLHLV